MHHDLLRVDNRRIKSSDEPNLFAVVRNETLRIPYFLQYYRSIGIKQFYFIDNGSSDDTREILLSQDDCHVFFTRASFSESRFGVDWLNSLLDEFGTDLWNVVADADELLVYDGVESRPLTELCAYLADRDVSGVQAVMLDLYSDNLLNAVHYKQGTNFLEASRYFDKDYVFARRFSLPHQTAPFPEREPIGGPRLRLCFPEQNTGNPLPRLAVKLLSKTLRTVDVSNNRFLARISTPAPQAFKVPLIRWRNGYRYLTSHRTNRLPLAKLTGALLHFKYFQDFQSKIDDAVRMGNHYRGSAEYKRYADLFRSGQSISFMYDGSRKYETSGDLIKYDIIQTEAAWRSCD